jgi:hypothetical protein
MKRILSFAVLLFSLSMLLFAVKTNTTESGKIFGVNLPDISTGITQIFGIFAFLLSVILLMLASRKKWSEWGEKQLDDSSIYIIWYSVFLLLYVLSFLKGMIEVVKSAPPWIVYPVSFIGVGLLVYIPIIAIKYFPRNK